MALSVGEINRITNANQPNYCLSSITFISGIPVFDNYNKNVFRGEVDSNITVRVLVYSHSDIQTVQLSETKNESSNTVKIYDLIVSVVSCNETITLIKCYRC